MFPHLDTSARIAMMQAHDTARELGHPEVGPDHVLLGLLADVRGDAYAVLTRHGLTYVGAREVVARDHAERPTPDAGAATADPATDLDRDKAALLAVGIDLDRLRDSVRERFGEDLTDGWGERRERGPRDGRGGPRGRGHRRGPSQQGAEPGSEPDAEPGFGPGGPGRGRRGPRSRRFGDESLSPALREALAQLAHEARSEAHTDARTDDDSRGERRGREPRARLTAGRLLLAVLRSDDPAVTAVLASADDPAALLADAERLGAAQEQPTA